MPEEVVEGVILDRQVLLGRKELIRLFTREKGLISFVSSSHRRSSLLRTPLSWGEFILERRKSKLYHLRDFSPLGSFLHLRSEFVLLETAGKFLRALLRSQMEEKASPLVYQLFLKLLSSLNRAKNPQVFLLSFYLKLLKHEGLLALSESCSACGKVLLHAYLESGELFCPKHAQERLHLFKKEELDLLLFLLTSRSVDNFITLSPPPYLLNKVEAIFYNLI